MVPAAVLSFRLSFRFCKRREVDVLMVRVVFKLLGIWSTLFIFTRTVSALETASARRLDMVMMALQVSRWAVLRRRWLRRRLPPEVAAYLLTQVVSIAITAPDGQRFIPSPIPQVSLAPTHLAVSDLKFPFSSRLMRLQVWLPEPLPGEPGPHWRHRWDQGN